MGDSFSLLYLAHEMFHGYQHQMGFGGRTVNNEVEANLFAAGVALTYSGGEGVFGFSGTKSQEGNVYMQSMISLLYVEYSNTHYNTAIENFFRGDTRGDFYESKGYRVAPINPLINRFYPLIKLP